MRTYDISREAQSRRLDELEDELEAAVKEYERLGTEAAKKTTRAETDFAKVFLNTEGPEGVRRQTAIRDVAMQRYEARIAEHLVTTQREALRKLHAKIDMQRTRVANARKEVELAQSGGRP
jgi:hypothetical protein